jgi:hypothetical protein
MHFLNHELQGDEPVWNLMQVLMVANSQLMPCSHASTKTTRWQKMGPIGTAKFPMQQPEIPWISGFINRFVYTFEDPRNSRDCL